MLISNFIVFASTFVFAITTSPTLALPVIANTSTSITYPTPAALFQQALAPYGRTPFICTAIQITPLHAITVAECVTYLRASDVSIRIGTDASTYQTISLKKITIHPGFDSQTLRNDIAIVTLSSAVQQAHFPLLSANTNQNISTTYHHGLADSGASLVTLTSWGADQNKSENTTQAIASYPKLRSVRLLASNACEQIIRATCSTTFDYDPAQHFCTLTEGDFKAVAYGDAGGGVVDEIGGLVGLNGGSPTCVDAAGVALMVDLSAFRPWIVETVGSARSVREKQ